jgi:transmembrane sensor
MTSANQQIDEQAADWLARRSLRAPSEEEQADFVAWLAADVRHPGAYVRAEAVLARVERTGSGLRVVFAAPAPQQQGWSGRRKFLVGSIAASLPAVWGLTRVMQETVEKQSFSTPVGQIKEVVLSDGSVLSLNTDSAVSVEYTKNARNIRLIKGEALFDVAKNKQRPFVVSAEYTSVKAVGTSFAVSALSDEPVQILIREGVVELRRTDMPMVPVRAGANIHVSAPKGAAMITQSIPAKQIANQLAWQHGRIAMEGQTLEQAAEQFSRYSDVKIIVDPAVSNQTVTGVFATNDPVGFAKAAAAVLRLQAEVKDREVLITKN